MCSTLMMRKTLSRSTPMARPAPTNAFIDSASLHDAFAALRLGRPELWTKWIHWCLIDATYLLLFDNVRIVPGPGHDESRPVPGDERELAAELPMLLSPPATKGAEIKVRRWLSHPTNPLTAAWRKTLAEPDLRHWCALRRELFWERHIQCHIGLFNPEHISAMAAVLGVTESDLHEIHQQSTIPKTVKTWAKGRGGDAAQLADDAYVLSSLIRGKFHEYMARDSDVQLAAHPSRVVIAGPTKAGIALPPTNSSQYFVRLLIGSALRERDNRRIPTWRQNVVKARSALSLGAVQLPDLPESDAEALAIRVARRLQIEVSPQWQRRLLSFALESNLTVCSVLVFGPWAISVAGGVRLYKLVRGRSLADEITAAVIPDRDFHQLARLVPGRITRHLIPTTRH